MTQEQKELLLRDLCARLPYGVRAYYSDYDSDYEIESIKIISYSDYKTARVHLDMIDCTKIVDIDEIKPHLFPLSSMTEEQQIDLTEYLNARVFVNGEISFQSLYANTMDRWKRVFKWCIKNHFDICGLIPMGLAIDATGKNIY